MTVTEGCLPKCKQDQDIPILVDTWTVIVEENQLISPTCSPGAFIQRPNLVVNFYIFFPGFTLNFGLVCSNHICGSNLVQG